jgi:thioredoxin-like negative regulator of GroEL
MTPLPSQEFFEGLIEKGKEHDPMVVVRFGASWCAPCKRLDTQRLLAIHEGIRWFYGNIDEDDNTYTLGYCGLQQIPGFVCIKNGVPSAPLQCSNTDQVIQWIKKQFDL